MRLPALTMNWARRAQIACALFSLAVAGCDRPKPAAPSAEPVGVGVQPLLWKEFSGDKAMEHVRAQVAIGPRPSGSAAIEKARQHIVQTLQANGWEAERQEFEATPVPGQGALKFVNIIGRFPAQSGQPAARSTQQVILGSHYDTKRMPGVHFVGANDAGSSTGALLELSRVLAQSPTLASKVELMFFDGEEAIQTFGDAETGTDGLVGSRHYARDLRTSGRAKQFRYAIVWDMIGDKNLQLTLPADTPPALSGALITASEQLGHRKHIGFHNDAILDDHVPLAVIAKIPAMDMIDFDYPPWHTSGDTLDQLSPKSMEIIGQCTLWMLERDFSK